MALADVLEFPGGEVKAIELLASATAANGAPSSSNVGLEVAALGNLFKGYMPSQVTLALYSTAGSGAMDCTCRLWAYVPLPWTSGRWIPLGVGADALKGQINMQSVIGETSADAITHCETVNNPGHFLRLYLEIVAINGSATAITAHLIARKNYPL